MTVTVPAAGGIVVSGDLAATGNSDSAVFAGHFNVTLTGTWTGTALLQRSFDTGSTWSTASVDGAGTNASYTGNVSVVAFEPERNVLYRINFTRSSGTLTVRLSQSADVRWSSGAGTL